MNARCLMIDKGKRDDALENVKSSELAMFYSFSVIITLDQCFMCKWERRDDVNVLVCA